MSEVFEKLKALRLERQRLDEELAEPSYLKQGEIDARYARALRKQKIQREIQALKRECMYLAYSGDLNA